MTCIVSVIKDDKVWMGADSAGVCNNILDIRSDKKVFIKNDFLIGFTSSFRMGDILKYNFNPTRCEDWDLEKYMVTTFVDDLREFFSKHGFLKKDNNVDYGGNFLVGIRGRIFEIGTDFQVGWTSNNYTAIGSGELVAKGALYTMFNNFENLSPLTMCTAALNAAQHHTTSVREPFHILSI